MSDAKKGIWDDAAKFLLVWSGPPIPNEPTKMAIDFVHDKVPELLADHAREVAERDALLRKWAKFHRFTNNEYSAWCETQLDGDTCDCPGPETLKALGLETPWEA